MAPRFVVSEFPNDNPELHDGLVWACPTPLAPALPTLRLRPASPGRVLRPSWEPTSHPLASESPLVEAAPDHAEAAPLDVEAPAVAAAVEVEAPPPAALFVEVEAPLFAAAEPDAALETSDEPASQSPSAFCAFIAALSGVLLERGATRSAGSVGALLGESRVARDAFDAPTKKALVARGMLDSKTGRPALEFSLVARAWREVLDGTSGDLGACGTATLDVWGAEILAALLGAPRGPSEELRRALRQRGVAAFGILVAA